MTDIFDGDPLIILTTDGADMQFKGGQPVMDQGFLNHVNFSLLTESGHWSEDLERNVARRYNGEFQKQIKKPITRQMLIDSARSAEADVRGNEFKNVTTSITNPVRDNINLDILLTPPTRDQEALRLTRTGENWIQQRDNSKNDILNGN